VNYNKWSELGGTPYIEIFGPKKEPQLKKCKGLEVGPWVWKFDPQLENRMGWVVDWQIIIMIQWWRGPLYPIEFKRAHLNWGDQNGAQKWGSNKMGPHFLEPGIIGGENNKKYSF